MADRQHSEIRDSWHRKKILLLLQKFLQQNYKLINIINWIDCVDVCVVIVAFNRIWMLSFIIAIIHTYVYHGNVHKLTDFPVDWCNVIQLLWLALNSKVTWKSCKRVKISEGLESFYPFPISTTVSWWFMTKTRHSIVNSSVIDEPFQQNFAFHWNLMNTSDIQPKWKWNGTQKSKKFRVRVNPKI